MHLIFWGFFLQRQQEFFGQASGREVHSGHATAIGMSFAALVTMPLEFILTVMKLFIYLYCPLGFSLQFYRVHFRILLK